tara:strand:+ start:119 stop:424 length:306 start_codon:yes stop_codon:yes gene_type:complete
MNIYVGNLNFSTTEDEMRELFGGYGEVTSCKLINDRNSGRPRGFGFVEMSNDDDANRAISELNGTEFKQRKMVVSEAKPRENNDRGPRRPRQDMQNQGNYY